MKYNKVYDNVNMDFIVEKIAQWHHDRNLIEGSNDTTQFVKLMEECGELAASIARGKDIKDDIGDIIVVLTNIAERNGLSIKSCMQTAWEDIKDRKGHMSDEGVFIKESDHGC